MGIMASSCGLIVCAQKENYFYKILSKNNCKVNLTQNPNLSQRVLTSGISNIGLGIPLIKRWGMTRLNKKIFKSPRSVESLLILTFTTCFSLFILFILFSFLSFLSLLVPACPSLSQLGPAQPSQAQLGPAWPNLAQLALEPIKLHFILSGIFSPREANYCSNPFEVFFHFSNLLPCPNFSKLA